MPHTSPADPLPCLTSHMVEAMVLTILYGQTRIAFSMSTSG